MVGGVIGAAPRWCQPGGQAVVLHHDAGHGCLETSMKVPLSITLVCDRRRHQRGGCGHASPYRRGAGLGIGGFGQGQVDKGPAWQLKAAWAYISGRQGRWGAQVRDLDSLA